MCIVHMGIENALVSRCVPAFCTDMVLTVLCHADHVRITWQQLDNCLAVGAPLNVLSVLDIFVHSLVGLLLLDLENCAFLVHMEAAPARNAVIHKTVLALRRLPILFMNQNLPAPGRSASHTLLKLHIFEPKKHRQG